MRDYIDKTSHPHAGIAYLGAYSLSKGYETIVIDAKFERIGNKEVINRIIRAKPDVLCLTMRTPDVKECEKIAAIIKKYFPFTKVLVGGAHVTGLKERVLMECGYFDIGIVGEGEDTLVELLSGFNNNAIVLKDIKGIVYRDNGKILLTPHREQIKDLDTLLFPAWQLFPSGSDLPLFTSRGCPFSCNFCQRVMGQRVRTMSPPRVIAEMERNINDFNTSFFQIEDEVFGLSKKWINELLDLMNNKNICQNVKWFANSRVNIADLEIYKKMKNGWMYRIRLWS